MKETKAWLGVILLVISSAFFANRANAVSNNLSEKQALSQTTAQKAVFLVSKEGILKRYENVPKLSDTDLVVLLSAVGFSGHDLKEAWAIAKRESNGQPIRFNGNTSTGDSSYGLFQINMIGNLGPERREKFNLRSNSDLFNPVTNAKIAYYMTDGGKDWSSWKGITPRAQEWMAKFPLKM